MSDRARPRLDGPWVAGLARARGLELSPERAAEVAALVAPVLERFRLLADDLCADEDPDEFHRWLRPGSGE